MCRVLSIRIARELEVELFVVRVWSISVRSD